MSHKRQGLWIRRQEDGWLQENQAQRAGQN